MLFEQGRPYIYPQQFENGYRGHKERHMRIQLRNATVKALNSVIRTRNLEARARIFSGALHSTHLCVGSPRGALVRFCTTVATGTHLAPLPNSPFVFVPGLCAA